MKLYRLKRSQHLPITIDNAWDFFSNPHNLHKITPAWLDLKITNAIPEKMHAGMIIRYRVRPLFQIPTTWIYEITHAVEPVFFVDEMRSGPYRFWHHQHQFTVKSSGVEVQDQVHYALGFGLLGQILHDVIIRAKLLKIFDYRQIALEKIFESDR